MIGRSAVYIAVGVLACTSCTDGKLSRGRVSELLEKSRTFQGAETLALPSGSGCFSIQGRGKATRETFVSRAQSGADKRALELGLLELTFTEAPVVTDEKATPYNAIAAPVPVGCEEVFRNEFSGFFGRYAAPRSYYIKWAIRPSDRAKRLDEAGATKGSIRIYQKALIRVTGLIEQGPATTVAEYEWHWVPTSVGRELGLSDKGRTIDRAMFRKYDDGWRLVDRF